MVFFFHQLIPGVCPGRHRIFRNALWARPLEYEILNDLFGRDANSGLNGSGSPNEVNEETHKVAHTLLGSLTPSNIGMTVFRDLQVYNDTLTIQLETTTIDGVPVTRTLIWKRIS